MTSSCALAFYHGPAVARAWDPPRGGQREFSNYGLSFKRSLQGGSGAARAQSRAPAPGVRLTHIIRDVFPSQPIVSSLKIDLRPVGDPPERYHTTVLTPASPELLTSRSFRLSRQVFVMGGTGSKSGQEAAADIRSSCL